MNLLLVSRLIFPFSEELISNDLFLNLLIDIRHTSLTNLISLNNHVIIPQPLARENERLFTSLSVFAKLQLELYMATEQQNPLSDTLILVYFHSGLDTFMSESLITSLKKLTCKGRSVLCTIHQPSAETFALFDKIILIKKGIYQTMKSPINRAVGSKL